MAISDTQKVDLLWKKVGFSKAKSDTNANKKAPNEAIVSDPIIKTASIWSQSDSIPAVMPSSNSSIVNVYLDSVSGAVETTEDGTASDNRTWKAGTTNWIPPSFGATYQLKVYAAGTGLANAQSSGTQLFETGSGNSDEWYFDYQSGTLHFIGTNLPTDIGTGTSNVIYVSGARYVGSTGISAESSGATTTLFKADLSAVYADGDINAGDVLVVTDAGDGEYGVYIANQDAPTTTSHLTTITTRDSATVDAGTFRSNVTHTSGNVTLGDVSAGSKIIEATITVTQVFDSASADLTIGDDSDPDRLFDTDYVDLTSLGSYVVNPNFVYTGTLDSANTIKAYVTQGTATQGAATVTVVYQ
jgi:hypothetical protein